MNGEKSDQIRRTRSRAWYILPILFGLLGGIIGYSVVKRDDPKLAKRILVLGIVRTALAVAVLIAQHH